MERDTKAPIRHNSFSSRRSYILDDCNRITAHIIYNRKIFCMVIFPKRKQEGKMTFNSDQKVSITAEYRRLDNGKYKGIVVQSLISRFSTDHFELPCAADRDTEEEALRDAKALVEKYSQ